MVRSPRRAPSVEIEPMRRQLLPSIAQMSSAVEMNAELASSFSRFPTFAAGDTGSSATRKRTIPQSSPIATAAPSLSPEARSMAISRHLSSSANSSAEPITSASGYGIWPVKENLRNDESGSSCYTAAMSRTGCRSESETHSAIMSQITSASSVP